MRRPLFIGILFVLPACSGGNDPSVSEAPHPSSAKKSESDSETYIIKKAGGLETEVLVEGTGRAVKAGDWITVHYRGRLAETEQADQTEEEEPVVFGDTFRSGVPFRLSLGSRQAIAGWQKGLPGLHVGSRVILRIPSELAYGEKGLASSRIPADADLEYEIQILDAVANADRR